MKFSFKTFDFINNDEPNKPAVVGSNRTVTWQEFQKEVNELCLFFEANRISKNEPIIIYGHKQTEMVIAMYACIKSAIPYIPIDIIYPDARIKKVAEIAGVNLIINCSENDCPIKFPMELRASTKSFQKNIFAIHHSPFTIHHSNDPIVYIIFTSGSTGEPKGVQITQTAVQSYLEWLENDFGFNQNDVFVNQAPFSFDLSVYELMSFANFGGTLLLNSAETAKNPDDFISRVKENKGSVWVSTPSFAFLYSQNPPFNSTNIPTIKTFLFCGETLPNALSRKLHALFPKSKILNTYGPTEATVATTIVEITPEIFQNYDPLPVGFPKSTCEIRILSDDNEAGGEIQIIGDNVSIGYLNREDLNKEKFVSVNGKRAFKTGDWGYFKNGMLFFTGRKDDQIKLHGYRIELDDINAAMHKLEVVENAITVPLRRNNEVKKLVAVIKISQQHLEKNKAELKQQINIELKKSLPEYMVPNDIRFTVNFIYNTSHKIDKKAMERLILEGKII